MASVTRHARTPFALAAPWLVAIAMAAPSPGRWIDRDDPPGSPEEVAALTLRDRELGEALKAAQRASDVAKIIELAREALEVEAKLARLASEPGARREAAEKLARSFLTVGQAEVKAGRQDEALGHLTEARRRLGDLFPGGNPDLASCLNELGVIRMLRGDYAEGVRTLSEAEDAFARFLAKNPDARTELAHASLLNNLGALALRTGDTRSAIVRMEAARASYERLLKAVDPKRDPDLAAEVAADRAITLDNLGFLELLEGSTEEASGHIKEAEEVFLRLYPPSAFPKGHPDVASNRNKIGLLEMCQGRYEEAQASMQAALDTFQNLVPGDHPVLAALRRNLALLAIRRRDPGAAEGLILDSIRVLEKNHSPELAPDGTASLAASYHFLGEVQRRQGQLVPARANLSKALLMTQRLAETFGLAFSEDLGIAYAEKMVRDPLDSFLSLDPDGPGAGARDYSEVWRSKALVTRILQSQDRLAIGPGAGESAQLQATYRDVRRQLSYLRIATEGNPNDLRKTRIEQLDGEEKQLEARLFGGRHGPSGEPDPAPDRLAEALPVGAVFVDLLAYNRLGPDPTPTVSGRGYSHYAAFVVARGRPAERVELGPVGPIDEAVRSWRASIERIESGAAPEALGRLWRSLEARFPAGTTAVVLSPDGALAWLPWAALPGRGGSRWLVRDYTISTAPHGPALLDWLASKPEPSPPRGPLLFVGGVPYEKPGDESSNLKNLADPTALIRDLGLLGSRKGLTLEEAIGARAKVEVVLDRLPKASWAYLEAHGFYLAEFDVRVESSTGDEGRLPKAGRSLVVAALVDDRLHLRVYDGHGRRIEDEVEEKLAGQGARIAAFKKRLTGLAPPHELTRNQRAEVIEAVESILGHPLATAARRSQAADRDANDRAGGFALDRLQLVLPRNHSPRGNGLVLGDGLLSADHITPLDLSKLSLVVLGACESGLGQLAPGEGVIGLQRALHQAGSRNVVASLWDVKPSMARRLMLDFHRFLVEGDVSRPEALRRAQLRMIEDGEGDASSPFFWAAWSVSGDPGPVRAR